jgi:hypothetical protein
MATSELSPSPAGLLPKTRRDSSSQHDTSDALQVPLADGGGLAKPGTFAAFPFVLCSERALHKTLRVCSRLQILGSAVL